MSIVTNASVAMKQSGSMPTPWSRASSMAAGEELAVATVRTALRN